MATKPTLESIRWATDETNNTPPTSGQRNTGWLPGSIAVSDYMNVCQLEAYRWASYLNDGLLSGKFGVGSAISAGSISGALNNWAPTGIADAVVVRASTPGTDAVISGITGGADGRVLILESIGSDGSVIELLHESTLSTDVNRIIVPGAVQAAIPDRGSAVLVYDATASRWRLVAGHYAVPMTTYIGASAGIIQNGSPVLTLGSPTSRLYWATSATGQTVLIPLPVRVGDRVRSLKFHLQDASGATIQCRILRSSVTGGTQSGDTMVSDGSGTDQALAVTNIGATGLVGSSSPFWYGYFTTNNANAMEIYGVELSVDRYLP